MSIAGASACTGKARQTSHAETKAKLARDVSIGDGLIDCLGWGRHIRITQPQNTGGGQNAEDQDNDAEESDGFGFHEMSADRVIDSMRVPM